MLVHVTHSDRVHTCNLGSDAICTACSDVRAGRNRDEKQATADELAACRNAQAATEQQLAAQREAGQALAAQKAQLAADLAAKQQALEAALQRCESAEASAHAAQLREPFRVASLLGDAPSWRVIQCPNWWSSAYHPHRNNLMDTDVVFMALSCRHSCRRSRC